MNGAIKESKDKSYNPLSNYSAESYFNLVKQASLAIKKITDAIILAGGFNPLNNSQTPWVEHLLELGILNYIDGFSIHPYSNNLPNKDFEIMDSYFDFSLKNTNPISTYILLKWVILTIHMVRLEALRLIFILSPI
jgi:hypothetical protein